MQINRGVSTSYSPSSSQLETVLGWHSWLDFESLEGLDSHLSRVYHTLATQRSFAVMAPASEANVTKVLERLNEAKLQAIVLKLHDPDNTQLRTAFFINTAVDLSGIKVMSDISGANDSAPYLVPDNRGRLQIFGSPAAENSRYELDNLRPGHLRRILSAMTSRQIQRVETGMFDANPLMTRWLYTRCGLVSDVPFHLLGTAWKRLSQTTLLRRRG